ncbi:MAG: FHA domain-containing protein, partial [Polyangiaceae bacterium]|nr:FHA domain-containing protein [Polyangiaceae bacterium]
GRAEDNTVRLTERNISRRHARLRRDSNSWLLEDAGSYNGSFVNGTRVSSSHRLRHADLLQLGDYKLVVIDEAQAADTPGAQPEAASVGPPSLPLLDQPDRLVMLVGPTPGVEFPLVSARMIIGRGEDCDIALNHSSVSRVHAEIQALQDGRYEIIDRGSANGVRVNAVELGRALLDSRDSIELGDVVLKFIRAGEVYRFEADESRQLALAAKQSGPSAGGKRVLSRSARVGASVLVLGAAGAIGVVALAVHYRSRSGQGMVSERVDRASRIFALAVRQFDEGQFAAAHETASELPADSNARQSREFRRIEAAWADMMFRRSAEQRDLTKARELLDRVAKTPSVDAVRRRRAADRIAQLDTKGLDVTQLPRQTARAEQPSAMPARSDSVNAPGRPRIHLDAPAAEPAPASGRAKAALSAKAPPKAALSAKASPTVAPKMVASGNLAQLTTAKESLKAKVRSGVATPQDMKLLRALCRQLGDTSCAQ